MARTIRNGSNRPACPQRNCKCTILWAHFSLCERCNTVSSFQSMWKMQYYELISVYVKDAILWAHFSLCVRCNTESSFQSMWKMQYCELISVYVKDAILWAHFSLCERCFSKTVLWASICGFWGSGSMPDGSNILCISALNQDTLWLYCKCHLKLNAWVTNYLYVITMRAGYEDTKHLCSS